MLILLVFVLASTCLAINLPTPGMGLRFNLGPRDMGDGDLRITVADLADHLHTQYEKDEASRLPVKIKLDTNQRLSTDLKKLDRVPEKCQITLCKIGTTFRLTTMNLQLPTPMLRKIEGSAGPDGTNAEVDEGCYEISQYNRTKLPVDSNMKPDSMQTSQDVLSKAFISGTLIKKGNQARVFKIIMSKFMKEYANATAQGAEKCIIGLARDYLRSELATFNQTYQRKNFVNGVGIKIATLQRKIEAAKRMSKDASTLQKKLDGIRKLGVHAIFVKTAKEALKYACQTKVFNKEISTALLEKAKVTSNLVSR